MTKKIVFLSAVLFALFFGTFFSSSKTEEHEYDIQKVKSLYVSSSFGDITVNTWENSQMYMKVEKWVEGLGDHEKFLEEVKLVEIYAGNTLRIEVKFPESRMFFKSFGVKITMYVPENYEDYFEIKNSFGDIRVSGLNSATTIGNSSGEITVENVSGDLCVDNSFGNIKAEKIGGSVKITNSSGDVSAFEIKDGIYVKNSFGKVNIVTVGGKVEIESSHNPITVENAESGVNVSNSFGDIVLKSVFGDIYARSSSGRIRVEMKKKSEKTCLDGKIENSFGDVWVENFAGNIDVKSSSGKIDIVNFEGVLSVKNSFGDINVVNGILRNGYHRLETSSGGINVSADLPDSGNADFITSFDGIRLSVPKNETFVLTAKTSFGDVKIRNLSIMENDNGEKLVNGGGEFILNLKASSGDIVVSGE